MPSAARTSAFDALAALAIALLCGAIVQLPDLVFVRASPNLDFWVHYNYAREYVAAIEAGEWRPRWAHFAHEGLGEPGLLYYAPLYYYAVWAVTQLTGSVWQAMQWVEIGGAAMLGWFAWRLCADWGYGRLSLLAVPLAVLAPNLVLLHNGFNGYPWATAGGALALLFWALMRPRGLDGRIVDPLAIGALALVICVHTVSGLMAVIMIGATGLPAFLRAPLACWRQLTFWRPAATIAGGLALSAWYLLPAFGSQDLIEARVWHENYVPYDAFSLPVLSAVANGVRWFGFQWPVSLVAFAVCGLGLWLVWRRSDAWSRPAWFAPALAVVAVTIFLATELSYPLWMIDSPLRNVQFPHRFVTLLEPVVPFLAVAGIARIAPYRTLPAFALGFFVLASLALGGALVAKSALIDGEPLAQHLGPLEPYPGLNEYRTAAAAERGYRSDDFDWQAHCRLRNLECIRAGRNDGAVNFTVDAAAPTAVTLPIFHFPSWQASIGSEAVKIRPQAETGLIELDVPAGRSDIALRWHRLPLETAGLLISIAALLAFALIGINSRRATHLSDQPGSVVRGESP